MVIPASWPDLSADEKRERTLTIAGELFSGEGLDVAMPVVAERIGIGVGSLYRQFATKEDLVAEIVLERVMDTRRVWEEAGAADDAWQALHDAVIATVESSIGDAIAEEMVALKRSNALVAEACAPIIGLIERVVDKAKAQGALRPDATVLDVRLIFRGMHDAESLEPGGAARLAELTLAGLRAAPQPR